jgi:RNA recognition motif-containing protein
MSTRLYVGNISFDTTEEKLSATFGDDGRQVRGVDVIMDRDTGRPRGFAFVEMESEADAESAISALDGADLDGRNLRVNIAEERRPRSSSGGGGGGGGGRGGGGGGGGDRW